MIVLIFAIYSFAAWNFNVQIEKEMDSLLSQAKVTENQLINQQKLVYLPPPVQRWLNRVGIVGKEPIEVAYIQQKGK
nr:DUF6544 family protein [Bacillus dakarensis]